MSAKEEQLQEIEALSSIYPDEITVLSENPYPEFTLTIKPTSNDSDDLKPYLQLNIKFHGDYPDRSPHISVVESENVDDVEALENQIQKICAENLGMPVIFTLASDLSEQLSIQSEKRLARRKYDQERKQREEEDAEQKRFEGTRVTVETFIKWKVKFDAEQAELSKTVKVDESELKKLNGRQLFEKDRSLYDSDIKFISGEGGELVEVDESLFEDMLDLELDDGGNVGIDLSDIET